MAITLRDYQLAIIDEARALMQTGCKSLCIVSPTGSGKTALTAQMIKTSASKGLSSWFIVHRRELVKQSALAFHQAGINFGIVASGFPFDAKPMVQICAIQTLTNRLEKLKPPSLIVWDESHHVGARTWEKVRERFSEAYHIGLTATPERLDGKGLRKYFSEIVLGPRVQDLIDEGYLCPYRLLVPSTISMAGVKTQMGDYARAEAEAIIDKPHITGDAIREYKKLGGNKRAVVFCMSVKHSNHVVDQFNRAGISAIHVDGETDSFTRDGAIKAFERGDIRVLSNVNLFGEGFDLPSIEIVILLRPTQSLSFYLQSVGRALRPSPNKTQAIILDHAGNVERHGLPCDDRAWSLDGRGERLKNTKDSGPAIRICEICFGAQPSGKPHCIYCNNVFQSKNREIDHVDGDLVEIDPSRLKRKPSEKKQESKTLDELYKLGVARGYKHARKWAQHVFQMQQAKRIGIKK